MFNRALLEKLTSEQLLELHRLVADVYKSRKSKLAFANRHKLNNGDKVQFANKKSITGLTVGRIVDIRQTRCTVVCESTNVRWNVELAVLKAVPNKDIPNVVAGATY